MKKILTVVCGLACLICLLSRPAFTRDALSRGFEKARTLVVTEQTPGVTPDIRPPELRPIEPGHDLGDVTGADIAMKVYDHAVAGAVNGAVAWGFFDEAASASKLIMRKYGQTISAEFKRQPDKSLGGVITSGDGSSQRSTSVFLAGADMASRTFKLRINDAEVVVAIAPEGISNGHFVNPTYSTVIGGKPVSYRIEVEGCFGYSIQMAMIILGAYAH
ncbi:MAG: hypothetical protein KKH28_05280 [Elusimicrobia bacterium]|nr:hypothetical protein [Elusimicrobiota bacterium]